MKRITIYLLLISVFASCSSIQIINDYDKSVDFSSYKTFTLLPWNEDNSKLVGPYGQRRIYNSIRTEMESRGYVEDDTNPDVALSPIVVIEQKTGTTAYSNYYSPGGYYGGYGYGYGGWGMGMGYSNTTYSEYEYMKGTLIIDLFDVDRKELVWQGGAVGTYDDDRNRGDKEKDRKMAIVMRRIFSKYPVSPKK